MKKYSIILGIIGTISLIIGIFWQGDPLIQKILFSSGNILLLINAIIDNLKMFVALEIVVNTGSTLAYFENIMPQIRFGILVGLAIIGAIYLLKKGFFRKNYWEIIGGLGLIILAIGFSTSPETFPLIFNLALGIGSILMAIYALINFIKFKKYLSLIFFVLNILFTIPIVIFFL